MKTMRAKYPGVCRGCGGKIGPGEMIDYLGRGQIRHAGQVGSICRPYGSDHSEPDLGRMFDRAVEDSMAEACGLGGFGERD